MHPHGSNKVGCLPSTAALVLAAPGPASTSSSLFNSRTGTSSRIFGRRRCLRAIRCRCRGLFRHRHIGFPPHSPNSTGPPQFAHTIRASVTVCVITKPRMLHQYASVSFRSWWSNERRVRSASSVPGNRGTPYYFPSFLGHVAVGIDQGRDVHVGIVTGFRRRVKRVLCGGRIRSPKPQAASHGERRRARRDSSTRFARSE